LPRREAAPRNDRTRRHGIECAHWSSGSSGESYRTFHSRQRAAERGDRLAGIKAAGYNGDKVVLLHPTDQPFYDAMCQVAVARLKAIGVNVDDQSMDWGTVVQRWASKEPIDQGGWPIFRASFPAVDHLNPLATPAARGNGGTAWFGWPDDPKLEALHDQWIDSGNTADQKRLASAIQDEVFTYAPYVPLRQYFPPAAWRKSLAGQLKGQVPVFWNIAKA
jgi:peptide/nickel transport system substrate-binding protein